jgi:hypothetical protein
LSVAFFLQDRDETERGYRRRRPEVFGRQCIGSLSRKVSASRNLPHFTELRLSACARHHLRIYLIFARHSADAMRLTQNVCPFCNDSNWLALAPYVARHSDDTASLSNKIFLAKFSDSRQRKIRLRAFRKSNDEDGVSSKLPVTARDYQ